MLSKAITICALVAIGVQLVLAVDGLKELKAKLAEEKVQLKAGFKDRIQENFLKVQNEVDKFIVENYQSSIDVASANSYKKLSVIFARLETQKYAALRSAIDITDKIYEKKFGDRFEICNQNLTFDAEVFDVLRQRVKTFALAEVYNYAESIWDNIHRLLNHNEGKVFSEKSHDLVHKMIELRNEGVVETHEQMIKAQKEFCDKHDVEFPNSLTTELDILIRGTSYVEFHTLRNGQEDSPRIVCKADLADLVDEYVGSRLIKDIENTDDEVFDLGRLNIGKGLGEEIGQNLIHVDSHEVGAHDEFFFAKN